MTGQRDISLLLGRTIAGKYVVEAVIGDGGSGTVYRARQLALDRTVALKVLHREFAQDQQFISRFKREAQAASRLDHPNSVRVLDFGHDDDSCLYLAMEHVEGRTLQEVIRDEWPLSNARIVDLLSQVLAALGVAHELGVIHRDLKPENIIVVSGRSDEGTATETAKVCDFGIATLATIGREKDAVPSQGHVTGHGFVVGTPEYMSPEQLRGEPPDQRTDLYAVGVVLYQLLTGRLPFYGESPLALAVKQATETPTPPSRVVAADVHVNLALEAICLKAMNKRAEDRFASAREMRAALRAWSVVTGIHRRRRGWWWAGGIAAAVLALGAVLLVRGLTRSRRAPAPPPAPLVASARSLKVAAATVDPSTPPTPPTPPTPVPLAEEPIPQPEAVVVHRAPIHRSRERRARRRLAAVASAPTESRAPSTVPAISPKELPRAPDLPPAAIAEARPPRSKGAITPASPPAPALNLDHAGVAVTGVTTTSAIPGSSIRAALSRAPFLHCYRDALRVRGSAAAGTADLHLRIDVMGYVTAAVLQDAQFLPSMKGCIEQAARAVRVKDVDTGDATAVVTLTFLVAP
jgi:serine/threonine protein kinase